MNTMPKKVLAFALAGAILSGSVQADPYLRDVAIQLAPAAVGGHVTHAFDGRLTRGAFRDLNIFLEKGVDYRIQGACDRDCDDMDLELFNGSGRPVSSDLAPDAFPVVWTKSNASGYYTLRVSMPQCDINPCTYGVVAVAE